MRVTLCRSRLWSIASAAVLSLAMLGASACSPVMAAKQPSRKDVDLLSPGIPRNLVLAELGQPVATEIRNGKRVEVFSFVQGYRKGVRVGRTIGHAAGDVLTLGGDFFGAEEAFQAAAQTPGFEVRAASGLARVYARLGRYCDMAAQLKRAARPAAG